MPSPAEIRKQITNQIITALEQNLVPWRQPWRSHPNAGRPANVLSARTYSGINPLLLELHSWKHDFSSRWWGTFRQWHELGGMVNKRPNDVSPGQWGAQIVFYKSINRVVVDPDTGEEERDHFPVLRTFTVFNADQVSGDAVERFKVSEAGEDTNGAPDFAPAEELIAGTGADVHVGGDSAVYIRPLPIGSWPNHSSGDFIRLPHKSQFEKPGAFYETAFHELAHWSEVRLGWDHNKHGYETGELVAEMAASFLATELGVPDGEYLQNHAAYLRTWLDAMKADPSFIFKASTQASKVTDYLLSFVKKPNPEEIAV